MNKKRDKLEICEHCGTIVTEYDIAKNTLLCCWCFKDFMWIYHKMKAFRNKKDY